jgi:hypothetical protein
LSLVEPQTLSVYITPLRGPRLGRPTFFKKPPHQLLGGGGGTVGWGNMFFYKNPENLTGKPVKTGIRLRSYATKKGRKTGICGLKDLEKFTRILYKFTGWFTR